MSMSTGNGDISFDGEVSTSHKSTIDCFSKLYDPSLHEGMVSPQRELIDMLHELQDEYIASGDNNESVLESFKLAEEHIGNLSDKDCKAYIAMLDAAEGSDFILPGSVFAQDIIAYATNKDPVPSEVASQREYLNYAAAIAGYMDAPAFKTSFESFWGTSYEAVTTENWDDAKGNVYENLTSLYHKERHADLYNSDGKLKNMRAKEYLTDFMSAHGMDEDNIRAFVDKMDEKELISYISLIDIASEEPQAVPLDEVDGIILHMHTAYADGLNMPQEDINNLSKILYVDNLREHTSIACHIDSAAKDEVADAKDEEDRIRNTMTFYDMMMDDPENFIANLHTMENLGNGMVSFAGAEVELDVLEEAVQSYFDDNNIDIDLSDEVSKLQAGQPDDEAQRDIYMIELLSGARSIDDQTITDVLTEALEEQTSVDVNSAEAGQTGQIKRTGQTKQTDQTERTGQTDQTEQTDQTDQTEQTDQTDQTEQTDHSDDYDIACMRAAYDVLIYNSGGNGADRVAWCESQGLAYEDVQAMVNQIYNEANATGSTYTDMRDAFEISVSGGDYEIADETTDVNNASSKNDSDDGYTASQGVGYMDYMVASGIDDGQKYGGSYVISNENEMNSVTNYVEAIDNYGGIDKFMTDLTAAYESGSTGDFIADLSSAELSGYAGYITSIADNNNNLGMDVIAAEIINNSHPNTVVAYEAIEETKSYDGLEA